MKTSIKIFDPSGEMRKLTLKQEEKLLIGRTPECQVTLRDPTLPALFGELIHSSQGIWMKCLTPEVNFSIGDQKVKDAQIPFGLEIKLGETRMSFMNEKLDLEFKEISYPNGVKPWLSRSDSGKKLLWSVKKAAKTPLAIYLEGETGTGKEVLAHLIHAWSDRARGSFVPLNCAALPLSLAESELFGHVKGAFTGASNHRPGALMQAHLGTLFLDEVGDLPLEIQVKLLRFLENGEIKSVGSDSTSKADVRIICATHKPLLKLVEEGKFRRDLYYRLASITIQIPTLRSRIEDIEALAQQFAKDLGKTISEDALMRLKAYPWPGNVRELRHAIERASADVFPYEKILPERVFDFLMTNPEVQAKSNLEVQPAMLTLFEMERVMLLKALNLSRGNRSKAAKILGVARSTLFEMLKRHKIMGPKTTEFDWLESQQNIAS